MNTTEKFKAVVHYDDSGGVIATPLLSFPCAGRHMTTDVAPDDWTRLDPWWAAYAETQSIARSPAAPGLFGTDRLATGATSIPGGRRT